MDFLRRMSPYQPALWLLSVLELFSLNGIFLYYALFRPEVMASAQQNPINLVFIAETFLLVAFAAWVIAKLGFKRPGWLAFAIMSIIGSLAFSVPFFLLLHIRKRERVLSNIQ